MEESYEAISQLHRACFDRGWSAQEFADLIASGAQLQQLCAEDGASTASFLLSRAAADELEILTLATAPEYRRQGLAAQLVDALCQHYPAHRIFLEVRADNVPAQSLYMQQGFRKVATRPDYYRLANRGLVDAVVMERAKEEG